jgi:hypothetical protein
VVDAVLVAHAHQVPVADGVEVGRRAHVGVEAGGPGQGPGVAGGELGRPQLAPGAQVEGDGRVAVGRGRQAVGLPGADVEDAPVGVDGGRRPHRDARALAGAGVGHPERPGHGAGGGVEGGDVAVERRGLAPGEHLVAADPRHHQPVDGHRRPEDHGLGVLADGGLPCRRAGAAVEGDDAAVERAGVDVVVVEGDGAADVAPPDLPVPAGVAGGCVEGPDMAGPVADVDDAAGDDRRAGHPLDPRQLPGGSEAGHRVGGDRGLAGGHPGVGEVGAEDVPGGVSGRRRTVRGGVGGPGRPRRLAAAGGRGGQREGRRGHHAQDPADLPTRASPPRNGRAGPPNDLPHGPGT